MWLTQTQVLRRATRCSCCSQTSSSRQFLTVSDVILLGEDGGGQMFYLRRHPLTELSGDAVGGPMSKSKFLPEVHSWLGLNTGLFLFLKIRKTQLLTISLERSASFKVCLSQRAADCTAWCLYEGQVYERKAGGATYLIRAADPHRWLKEWCAIKHFSYTYTVIDCTFLRYCGAPCKTLFSILKQKCCHNQNLSFLPILFNSFYFFMCGIFDIRVFYKTKDLYKTKDYREETTRLKKRKIKKANGRVFLGLISCHFFH